MYLPKIKSSIDIIIFTYILNDFILFHQRWSRKWRLDDAPRSHKDKKNGPVGGFTHIYY